MVKPGYKHINLTVKEEDWISPINLKLAILRLITAFEVLAKDWTETSQQTEVIKAILKDQDMKNLQIMKHWIKSIKDQEEEE